MCALDGPGDRVGAAGEEHHHHGGAGGDDRLDELALQAREIERLDVVALADGAAAEEARAVAHDDDGDVASRRQLCRGGDARPVVALDVASRLVADLGFGQCGAQGLEHRRDLESHLGAGVVREHVVGERVAAHEGLRAVGVGPEHGDPTRFGAERQHPVIGQQHRALLGEPARDAAVRRAVEVDLTGRAVEVGVEQTQLLLLREDAGHRPVDHRLVEEARPHPLDQGGVGVQGGQLDVDAGLERELRCLTGVGGDLVHRLEEGHGEVVGDDDPVEAPSVAQELGEVFAGCRDGHPVDLGVGVHHRAHAAVTDRHLERRQEDVRHLAGPRVYGRMVAPCLRAGVPHEVLQGGVHARILQPPHIGRSDGADDVGVFGDALVDPSPPRIADDVEHRRQALVDAELAHRPADEAAHLGDEVGIEGRAPRQRCGEGGRLPGRETGETLLVHERGDPQASLALQPALLVPQPLGPRDRIDRAGAVDPREVPDSMHDRVLEPGRGLHLAREGSDHLIALVDPEADELAELLLEGHAVDQAQNAFGCREGRGECHDAAFFDVDEGGGVSP